MTTQLYGFVAPIIGSPAWGAKQGYGSFVTLEFGAPRLIVKEWQSHKSGNRRQAYVQGQHSVWIYCCEWRFSMNGEQIAWSEDNREEIARATGMIDGQKLLGVSVDSSNGRSTFEFDLGGRFETWPAGEDPTEEQWFIYGPNNVFAYRADGHYSLQPADTPREHEQWQPLFE